MADSITALQDILGVSEDDAEELMLVTHWVDHQMAIRQYGYPKDNLIPVAMSERMEDLTYVELLLEAAQDEGEVSKDVLDALRAHRLRLSGHAE